VKAKAFHLDGSKNMKRSQKGRHVTLGFRQYMLCGTFRRSYPVTLRLKLGKHIFSGVTLVAKSSQKCTNIRCASGSGAWMLRWTRKRWTMDHDNDDWYLEFSKREFPRSGIAGIPYGIPASKTALSWEFPGIPIEGGFCSCRGGSFAYIVVFLVASHT